MNKLPEVEELYENQKMEYRAQLPAEVPVNILWFIQLRSLLLADTSSQDQRITHCDIQSL